VVVGKVPENRVGNARHLVAYLYIHVASIQNKIQLQ